MLHGSRDTLRLAFERELIHDGEDWMLMLQDRNLTEHTYNDESAQQILVNIRNRYLGHFQILRDTFQQLSFLSK